MNQLIEYAGAVIGGVLALYVCARVVTAAYFKSKQDHDNNLRNPT